MRIIILGSGVAARIINHMLISKGFCPISMFVYFPHTNNMSGGVRYLEVPDREQPNYAQMLGNFEKKGIDGGVVADDTLYSWNEIFSDVAYKHYLTGRYAIEQKRPWKPDILNKLFLRDEPPQYVSNISYQEFVDNLKLFQEEIIVQKFTKVDLQIKRIHYEINKKSCFTDYDVLINTLPMNIFNELACKDPVPMKISSNFELVQETSYHRDIMWYVLGHGNLKRISSVHGKLKLEFKKSDKDPKQEYHDSVVVSDGVLDLLCSLMQTTIKLSYQAWTHNNLPPNFSVDENARDISIFELPEGVYHLGRFAEAQPKAMIGDMIESAHIITNCCLLKS